MVSFVLSPRLLNTGRTQYLRLLLLFSLDNHKLMTSEAKTPQNRTTKKSSILKNGAKSFHECCHLLTKTPLCGSTRVQSRLKNRLNVIPNRVLLFINAFTEKTLTSYVRLQESHIYKNAPVCSPYYFT